MAHLIDLGGAPVNEAERVIIKLLADRLPGTWSVIPNASLPDPRTGHAYEYDAVVVGGHAVYVVEVKGWRGLIRQLGQADWQLDNGRVERNPLPLADQKARILASHVKKARLGSRRAPFVQACLVCGSDQSTFEVFGTDARRCLRPSELIQYLLDPSQLPVRAVRDEHRTVHDTIVHAITGPLRARRRVGRRYGSYTTTSLQERDEERAVFLGRHAMLDDDRVVRVRAWYLSDYKYTPEQRASERTRLMRAAEALAKVGDHPRIATLRDFGEHDGEFYEVTDWTDTGTLATAFARGALARMTADSKVRIVRDVAEALEAAWRHGVFHRALDPETVLLDADGRARLTGFDLAFVEGAGATVYGGASPRENGCVPPELRDPADYDVFDNSDLYSLAKMASLVFGQDLPEPLVSLLDRCMRDEPSERPSDPAVFLAELDEGWRPPDADSKAASIHPAGEAAFELAVGEVVGGVNVVLAELGRGVGSIVYRVENEPLGAELALKLMVHPSEGYDARAEYSALRAVDSAHIPRAHWMGRIPRPDAPALPYLLLELVEGERLSDVLERGPIELEQASAWIDDLLDGLAALHRSHAGVLHRDVKPENIIIGPKGAVLVDFGTARERTDPGRSPEGSLRYSPPDLGETGWEPQADVFAAACVAYTMLTGAPPWSAAPSPDARPKRVDALCPDVPSTVADVLERALAPVAAERFVDADSLRRALGEAVAPPPSPPVGTSGTRTSASLAAAVVEAGTAAWTASRVKSLTRHPDLQVALAAALRECIVPWAAATAQAARDGLLESEARAFALEQPLPEAMPHLYDVLMNGALPSPWSAPPEGESRAAWVDVRADDQVLWFDALHFTEWAFVLEAADVLNREASAWAWASPSPTREVPLDWVFDSEPDGAKVATLPRGDRAAVDLGALMKVRRERIEDELLAASEGGGRIWVGASAGLIYLGHGLRRDVGDAEGDRADAVRATWAAAFPKGRIAGEGGPLPSRLLEPVRVREGHRFPVGRLAWPDAPGTPWLQAGGLSLPESVLPLFCLSPGDRA